MLGIFPADEFTLYDDPVEVVVVSPAAPPAVQVCKADPTRVYLLLGVGTSATANYLLSGAAAGVTPGLLLNKTGIPFIEFRYTDSPRLCQAAWWIGLGGSPGSVYAITQSLRRPPELAGYADVLHKPKIAPAGAVPVVPRSTSPRRRARQELPAGVLRAIGRRCPHIFPAE